MKAILAEIERLCVAGGDADAAKMYGWSTSHGAFRKADASERTGTVDLGSGRDDMQNLVEADVAEHLRLRTRRAAIGGMDEPAWSLAIHPLSKALLAHVGVDASTYRDDDVPCGWCDGMRVDYVHHQRGSVLTSAHLGSTRDGDVSFQSYAATTEIRIEGLHLPDTVLVGIAGEPLSSVMPHPFLDRNPEPIAHATTCKGPGSDGVVTILFLETRWEALKSHHQPRPWLLPGELPRYDA